MTLALDAELPPLVLDADGIVRVVGTRVTLDSVVGEFQEGATAEEIAQRYPSLNLSDVYAVIAYYLRRRSEVETYLAQRQTQAEAVRHEYSKIFDQSGIRERLVARRGAADTTQR